MKADNRVPVKHLHGSIYGLQSDFYFRVLNDQQIIQHKPKFKKPPTPKQIAARQLFKQRFAALSHPQNGPNKEPSISLAPR